MDRKILVLGLSTFLWLISFSAHTAPLSITFLDVGEGEAILIRNGSYTALVDSGNVMTGSRVKAFLRSQSVSELDTTVITHPHLDHMSGIFHPLPGPELGKRYDNGQALPVGDIFRWYQTSYRSGDYHVLAIGDELHMQDAQLTVLNSTLDGRTSLNGNSLVLRITHGEITMLLMGDADASVEQGLLEKGAGLNAQLLKVGHHGSIDSSSNAFLDAVAPDYAVISIDKDNVRGYPSAEVLKRFAERNIITLATYEQGDITFHSDGQALTRIP
jgi:competence protein ComEC